jgi:enoyl-CoA hydratase
MAPYKYLLVDDPAPFVRRLTLNRPEKRNALCNSLRGDLFDALEAADRDDAVRVSILRGAGKDFCSGYDLSADNAAGQPYHTARGLGQWPRHVVEGAFRIWDLAKPVIAQVHGHCLAGGTELATACDLVYVAEDAKIGYPVTRIISPPDAQVFPWLVGMRHALEMMLTGDAISGIEAAQWGFATRAAPAAQLEAAVLAIAERVAKVPAEVQQFNKRSVHRAMEAMGMRNALRAGTELQALAAQTPTAQAFFAKAREDLTRALTERDQQFGDYRTQGNKNENK